MCAGCCVQAMAGGAASVAATGDKAETVTDLVRAVREEEFKVHTNVEEAVRVRQSPTALLYCVCTFFL